LLFRPIKNKFINSINISAKYETIAGAEYEIITDKAVKCCTGPEYILIDY